jgi:hypothetical protein
MEPYKMINHKGKSIIYSDLTNFDMSVKDELQKIIDQVKAEVAKHPPGSVLIVTDVTESHFDTEIIEKFVDYTAHNKPYIKASAVVGTTGLRQTALYSVLKKTLRDIHSFDSQAEALDWLAEQ